MLNFRDYLDYAERYLRRAEDEDVGSEDINWLLIPATVLAWTAIESFVNNRLDDYGVLPEDVFELHERAFLLEKRLRFVDRGSDIGCFVLEGAEYHRLEDKIFFLIAKFSSRGAHNIRGQSLWQNFEEFKDVRNGLMHPRRDTEISLSVEMIRAYIQTTKAIIQLVSEHIWDKKVDF